MHAVEDFWGKRWRDAVREDGGRSVVVYFQGALERWECRTGWGRDVMNSPKEQHWTLDRKCDEAQRPPSAYQTDDFSLSDVVLALSTIVRLNDNASSWRGGQVKKKYLGQIYDCVSNAYQILCSALCSTFRVSHSLGLHHSLSRCLGLSHLFEGGPTSLKQFCIGTLWSTTLTSCLSPCHIGKLHRLISIIDILKWRNISTEWS